jgi:hypothetical protein
VTECKPPGKASLLSLCFLALELLTLLGSTFCEAIFKRFPFQKTPKLLLCRFEKKRKLRTKFEIGLSFYTGQSCFSIVKLTNEKTGTLVFDTFPGLSWPQTSHSYMRKGSGKS